LIFNVEIKLLKLCGALYYQNFVENMKNPFSKKNNCIQCKAKFSNHEDLVVHVRHEHHKTIVKCQKCGKEFIHEKDRLHHARKEHEEEMRKRSNKKSYPEE
jgi:DNA-directed RNA polymerase subunit RPC12/RpoP